MKYLVAPNAQVAASNVPLRNLESCYFRVSNSVKGKWVAGQIFFCEKHRVSIITYPVSDDGSVLWSFPSLDRFSLREKVDVVNIEKTLKELRAGQDDNNQNAE